MMTVPSTDPASATSAATSQTPAQHVPDLADIREAAKTIAGEVVLTPCVQAPRLAAQLSVADLYLKLENQQFTGSFKDRGALNKLKSLTPEEAKRGVIAMSAGNHAQGVAYHAQRLGIPATIVMPEGTPFTKIERTASFGPRVILQGEGIDAAATYAREVAAQENLVFVHPYDDPYIVAGQGTAGLEILEQAGDLDCLIIPIGGGGLISGIATAVKALKPEIEIYGVESALYPSMHHAVNGLAPANGGQTIAEGIAVKSPGALTRSIVERLVKDVLLVDEIALERAVHMLVETQRIVAEGAGAAGLAALIAYPELFQGRKVGLVICGGNIDARVLAQVMMRGLVREGRIATLRIEIADQPGVLASVAKLIGSTGANIIEVHHQRMFFDLPVKRADIDVSLETRNPAHVDDIIARLKEAGFLTRRLSSHSTEG
ncbi:threonine ammonia-lyase [Dongia soli]|uniref:L-serine dehydratase n=1 Tax=Dongia soli TaxID=600628 RepID=A0ABU5ECV2_9PROT|nr:threonine ammonia-lyase [Dongia soli]MDY0883263.1 threonine ammonia-lyase [Dongia soli]